MRCQQLQSMQRPSKFVIAAAVASVSALAAILVFASSSTASMFSVDSSALSNNSKSTIQVNSVLNTFNSSPQIRADILISANRNDGTQIENERFEEIRTELANQFGGVTVLPRFNGTSIHDGVRNDGTNNSGFFVVIQNTPENIEWLIEYKQTLKERLNQDRIFMTFSPTVIAP
jgi:hypothetical protein